MMSPRNLSVAAVLLAAVFLAAVWLAPVSPIGVLAFAEVQGQVEKTESVQYTETETRQNQTPDGKKSGLKIETRVMTLGRYFKREDQKLTPGDRLEGLATWNGQPAHVILVIDAKAGKKLLLFPESKRVTRIPTSNTSPHEGPEGDFYEQMRRLPSGEAEKLPERTIDGKRTLGFRFVVKTERKGGTNTLTRDIWVDPTTKLPLRMEATFRSTVPTMGRRHWIFSDFIWDAPLDQSLFSTDPPKGYTETKK